MWLLVNGVFVRVAGWFGVVWPGLLWYCVVGFGLVWVGVGLFPVCVCVMCVVCVFVCVHVCVLVCGDEFGLCCLSCVVIVVLWLCCL